MVEQVLGPLLVLGPAAVVAFLLTVGLILLLRPWLARYALARPNTRSSHHTPTPQGGGIAVVIATFAVTWGVIVLAPALIQDQGGQYLGVTVAVILVAAVGAIDDMRSFKKFSSLRYSIFTPGRSSRSSTLTGGPQP